MNRVIGSKADQNELTTFYYRLRLTVNPFNYLERIAGPQVNLSLSVALNSFLMRNKVKTTTHGSFKE